MAKKLKEELWENIEEMKNEQKENLRRQGANELYGSLAQSLNPSPIPCLYSYSVITMVKTHMREIYLGGKLLGHELP